MTQPFISLEQHAVYDERGLASKYFLLPKESPKIGSQSGTASTKAAVGETGGSAADEDLTKRVEMLEKALLPSGPTPGPNMSDSVASVFRDVCRLGCYSATFKWVPKDYYEWDLGRRAKTLGGYGTEQLTKAMLMENTRHKGESTRTNSKFYLVVVQYVATIDAKKLASAVRALPPVSSRLNPTDFQFRVASEEDNDRLTGFKHNSVSPFGLKEDIPVVLSRAVVEEGVNFIWMGGGDVDLKLGMGVKEFVDGRGAFVLDVSDKRAM
ncbi:hypothetical protein TrRE_jg13180 [Triparma retinervis]|uniref:YbaK/aminoacyl-tRNA synthetase-associated domain-containing protein n=1 Tax=Triparma retinervis TaxID=2557542 RepID=A0A9W7G722_9STRA|nr:hypothetical protein TrRE_jg13180 [Triparma retinervis]